MIDLSIPGWTTVEQLEFLQSLARRVPAGGALAEVGCLFGRASYVLASSAPSSARLYCIDPFVDGVLEGWTGAEVRANIYRTENFTESDFLKGLTDRHIANAVTIKAYSPLEKWENGLLDLVFIDGDHSYEGVKADILFWSQHLKPGGLLLGDDYTADFPGVKQAVQELRGESRVQLYRNIWLYVGAGNQAVVEQSARDLGISLQDI